MRVIYKKSNPEFKKRIKDMHPDFECEVDEVFEVEYFWWQLDWWYLKWWAFVIWFCEKLVPELKNQGPDIHIE